MQGCHPVRPKADVGLWTGHLIADITEQSTQSGGLTAAVIHPRSATDPLAVQAVMPHKHALVTRMYFVFKVTLYVMEFFWPKRPQKNVSFQIYIFSVK